MRQAEAGYRRKTTISVRRNRVSQECNNYFPQQCLNFMYIEQQSCASINTDHQIDAVGWVSSLKKLLLYLYVVVLTP